MADKELVRVTDLTYDDSNELVVTMVGRTKDGRRVVKDIYNTEPYMFVPEESKSPNRLEDDLRDKIIETRSGFRSYDGRRLVQIVTEYPSDVSDIRSEYPEEDRYETDIIYERRCTADYGLSGYVRVPKSQSIDISEVEDVDESKLDESISPRICIADIETEVPDVFTDDFAEEAPNKVQAITCYDSYDDEYTLFCLDAEHAVDPGEIRNHIEGHWEGDPDAVDKTDYTEAPITFKRFSTEKSLLKDYVHYIQEKRPDVVTGWNYVQFDHQYLVNRISSLSTNEFSQHSLSDIGGVGGWKIERFVPGMPAVDMMSAMQKIVYGERESWSLDYISHDVLGLGKVKGDENSYDENRSMFMAYNVVDVQLCVALNEAQGIMPFWYQIAEICSIPIYSVGSTMKECEGYLFKHRDQNEILPATDAESQKQAEGGLVLPPSDGVKDYVGVTDLKSLYPSSIITCNISKETMTYDRDEADIIVPDMPLNYEEVDDTITREDISWNLGEGNCVGFSLDTEGILPKYLKLLFSERERKKEMRSKHEPGTIEYEMYNYQQRAVKVIMNSFFGVSDNQYFRLSEEGLGDAITAASRFVQWYGVQKIEEQGYDVIYGDSVTPDTETVIRDEDGAETVRFDELFSRYESVDVDKEKVFEPGIEVQSVTENGNEVWAGVDEIIRHQTDKDVYEVQTDSGKSVKVTEDHSLLVWRNEELVEVSPTNLRIGDQLPNSNGSLSSLRPRVQEARRTSKCEARHDDKAVSRRVQCSDNRRLNKAKNIGKHGPRSNKQASKETVRRRKRKASPLGENKGVVGRQRQPGSRGADAEVIERGSSATRREGRQRSYRATSEGAVAGRGVSSEAEGSRKRLLVRECLERRDVARRANRDDGRGEIQGVAAGSSARSKEILREQSSREVGARQEVHNGSGSSIADVARSFYGGVAKGYVRLLREGSDGQARRREMGCRFRDRRRAVVDGRWMLLACLSRLFPGRSDRRCPGTERSQRRVVRGSVRRGRVSESVGVSDGRERPRAGKTEVVAIEKVDETPEYVYDLSVSETQTFIADGLYVHNTDSLMLELVDSGEHVSEPSDVIETGLSLEETLNKRMSPIASEFGVPAQHPYVDVSEMPHNLPDSENHLWQYEFEKLYRRFFQAGSKKRYAGWVVWDEGDDVDKIDTVGMESERSDTPSLAKSVQTNFIELVLKDNSFDELSEFIQEKVNGIENLSYGVDNIGKPSTINKPIEEYPNRPMPRAVEHINEYVDSYNWSVGDDPWLVYVDSSPDGQPVIDVIALPWTADTLPHGFELDVDKHIEMCLLQPIRPIIEEVEYTWAELKTGKKEQAVLTSNNDNSVSFGSDTNDSDVSFDDDEDESPVFDDTDAPKTESSAFDWS